MEKYHVHFELYKYLQWNRESNNLTKEILLVLSLDERRAAHFLWEYE